MDIRSLFSKNSPYLGITNPDFGKYRKIRIAIVFSLIGAVVFFVFVIDDFLQPFYHDLPIDSLSFMFFFLFPLLLVHLKYPSLWIMFILLVLIGLILRLVYPSNDSNGAVYLWFLAIPLISFLVLGKKLGFIPSAITLAIIIIFLFTPDLVNYRFIFPTRFKFHILLGYLTITFFSWIYELDRNNLEKNLKNAGAIMQKQKQELSQINRNLHIMVEETHHRVNNNLSMICNLIYLYKQNDGTKEQVLSELNDKILSIGNIHRMLSVSNDFSSIEMRPYLFSLVEELSRSYADLKPKITVVSDNLLLNAVIAVRIGLIVTELIINACKYGINPGGEISVALDKNNEQVHLAVENNGRKIPGNIDIIKAMTMGFSIVRSTVEFLSGVITLNRKGNTRIEIKFPAEFGGRLKEGNHDLS